MLLVLLGGHLLDEMVLGITVHTSGFSPVFPAEDEEGGDSDDESEYENASDYAACDGAGVG